MCCQVAAPYQKLRSANNLPNGLLLRVQVCHESHVLSDLSIILSDGKRGKAVLARGRSPSGDRLAWSPRAHWRYVMQELLRTNDVVRLEYVRAVLGEEGIETFVFDGHMSITEGSIGILPRRLMVAQEDADRARTILREVGEELGSGERTAW